MLEAEFGSWLSSVSNQYHQLTSTQCDRLLDHLIGVSKSAQLYHLSDLLNGLLKRDFITGLPSEVAHKIIQELDAETLLRCCHVSRGWSDVMGGCVQAWRNVCKQAGLAVTATSHDPLYWKHRYERCSERLKSLKHGEGFQTRRLFGHMDRVMAVYYHNGLLATGSDDHSVRVWNCMTGQCLKIIQTHTVAELKFDETYIFTASFDTTAACWDFNTGQILHRYTGHVAAVFSVDFSAALDIVITGSADSTVKVWGLTSGQLMQTLPHHRSNWIMQVRLIEGDGWYTILSRDSLSIHQWRVERDTHTILNMEEWTRAHNDLIPGLQVQGEHVVFAGVDSDNVCYIMEQPLAASRPCIQRVCTSLGRDNYAQALLGSGDQYDVLLTQGDRASVDIIRHSDQSLVSSTRLPQDYRQSKRMSTYCLCEPGWLDGFDGVNDTGVVFVTSLRDNSILVIQWSAVQQTNIQHEESDAQSCDDVHDIHDIQDIQDIPDIPDGGVIPDILDNQPP